MSHPKGEAYRRSPMLPLMHSPQILEDPYPQINDDWDSGNHQWREVTPLAYKELMTIVPLCHEESTAFMQSEPVDILPDGDGLYVCGKTENGCYFARLLAGEDWWKRDYVPVPEVSRLF